MTCIQFRDPFHVFSLRSCLFSAESGVLQLSLLPFVALKNCVLCDALYIAKTFRERFGHSDEIFPRSVWRWMLKANFKHAANFTELPPVFNLAYLAKFAAITI